MLPEGEKMIPLDVQEAMKSGVYGCATTGHGKSDIGMYVASLLMKHGIIVIVFDPSQDWMKRSNIPFTKEFDLTEIVPTTSTIIDFSDTPIDKQQEFVELFCKTIMQQQARTPEYARKQYFLIFEEADNYFPEGCMRAKRYQNTVNMMQRGRNFGVRFMCITPFSAGIDKKAMRYMKQRYFGATDEPNDVEYVLHFFPRKKRLHYEEVLPTLPTGQFIYKYGKHIEKIHIEPFKTEKAPQPIGISPQLESYIKPDERVKKIRERYGRDSSTDDKSLVAFVIALMWLIAAILAIVWKP